MWCTTQRNSTLPCLWAQSDWSSQKPNHGTVSAWRKSGMSITSQVQLSFGQTVWCHIKNASNLTQQQKITNALANTSVNLEAMHEMMKSAAALLTEQGSTSRKRDLSVVPKDRQYGWALTNGMTAFNCRAVTPTVSLKALQWTCCQGWGWWTHISAFGAQTFVYA